MEKNGIHTFLAGLHDESVALCRELSQCLRDERQALIQLKTDDVLALTLKKDALGNSIRSRRRQMTELVRNHSGAADIVDWESRLPADAAAEWRTRRESWLVAWEEVRGEADRNLRLLRHSLRNMEKIVGNIKILLGQAPTYTNRGKKISARSEGKVVEVKY